MTAKKLLFVVVTALVAGCDKPKEIASTPRATLTPSASAVAAAAEARKACAVQTGLRKLLWLDESYATKVDAEALRCLSEPERAAVGYVAAIAGSGCEWADAPGTEPPQHLDCKLSSAAGLGPQCEAKHKELIQRWLPSDLPATCYKRPTTAFAQEILDSVTLSGIRSRFTLVYAATGTSGPMGKTWTWTDTIDFEVVDGTLFIKAKKRTGSRPGG